MRSERKHFKAEAIKLSAWTSPELRLNEVVGTIHLLRAQHVQADRPGN